LRPCLMQVTPTWFFKYLFQHAHSVLIRLTLLGRIRVHCASLGKIAKKQSPLAITTQQVQNSTEPLVQIIIIGMVRLRMLCSSGLIFFNFLRFMSAMYFFLTYVLLPCIKRSWTGS
jgi:hypothetical protein